MRLIAVKTQNNIGSLSQVGSAVNFRSDVSFKNDSFTGQVVGDLL